MDSQTARNSLGRRAPHGVDAEHNKVVPSVPARPSDVASAPPPVEPNLRETTPSGSPHCLDRRREDEATRLTCRDTAPPQQGERPLPPKGAAAHSQQAKSGHRQRPEPPYRCPDYIGHLRPVPKRGGRWRWILVPARRVRRRQRREYAALLERFDLAALLPHAHGFVPGRSIVTAVQPHRGYRWTLQADIKDFFDCTTIETLRGMEAKVQGQARDLIFAAQNIPYGFVEGAARQGLPCSPTIANVAFRLADEEIAAMCAALGVVYTRYADDLIFSSNSVDSLKEVRRQLPEILQRHRYQINPAKWRLQDAAWGRRQILGLSVAEDIRVPRRTMRRLRLLEHYAPRTYRTRGLRAHVISISREFEKQVGDTLL